MWKCMRRRVLFVVNMRYLSSCTWRHVVFSVRCVPSKWRQHAALKRREVSTRLYEIKTQDAVIFQCYCQFGRYARPKTVAATPLFIEAVSPPTGSAVLPAHWINDSEKFIRQTVWRPRGDQVFMFLFIVQNL